MMSKARAIPAFMQGTASTLRSRAPGSARPRCSFRPSCSEPVPNIVTRNARHLFQLAVAVRGRVTGALRKKFFGRARRRFVRGLRKWQLAIGRSPRIERYVTPGAGVSAGIPALSWVSSPISCSTHRIPHLLHHWVMTTLPAFTFPDPRAFPRCRKTCSRMTRSSGPRRWIAVPGADRAYDRARHPHAWKVISVSSGPRVGVGAELVGATGGRVLTPAQQMCDWRAPRLTLQLVLFVLIVQQP